jgi:site-specific recombinase XerD
MEISKQIKSFEEEIKRKGYRNESVKNYISCVSKFLYYFKDKDSPKHINEVDVKFFLSKFSQHNTQRAYHSAIKCFYKYVVKQPKKFRYIEYCKRNRRLPIVLSAGEIQKLINSIENLKHKTIICLMYSTGVRIGELVNLKIEDIDSKRMIIRIRDGKGGKDREVTLDLKLLNLLRSYYIKYKPTIYLFNGDSGSKYSQSSVRQIIKKYGQLSGITKKLNPHLLRHCYGTHLVESGTDINLIQRLMGHNSVKTTNLYLHISNNLISKIKTPLSTIEI